MRVQGNQSLDTDRCGLVVLAGPLGLRFTACLEGAFAALCYRTHGLARERAQGCSLAGSAGHSTPSVKRGQCPTGPVRSQHLPTRGQCPVKAKTVAGASAPCGGQRPTPSQWLHRNPPLPFPKGDVHAQVSPGQSSCAARSAGAILTS